MNVGRALTLLDKLLISPNYQCMIHTYHWYQVEVVCLDSFLLEWSPGQISSPSAMPHPPCDKCQQFFWPELWSLTFFPHSLPSMRCSFFSYQVSIISSPSHLETHLMKEMKSASFRLVLNHPYLRHTASQIEVTY